MNTPEDQGCNDEDRADYEEAIRVEREARAAGEVPIPLADVKRRLGLRGPTLGVAPIMARR